MHYYLDIQSYQQRLKLDENQKQLFVQLLIELGLLTKNIDRFYQTYLVSKTQYLDKFKLNIFNY